MHVKAVCLLLSLGLAGCGGAQRLPPPGGAAGPSPQITVTPPSFGDTKPHPWDGRPPQSYAVHGIDASRWQGAVDWPRARAAGVSFAYLKATEGADRVDPQFETYWRGAAAAGIPRGAYHFYYICGPARDQARWFIRNVPRVRGALPPVLDIEWNAHSPTCRKRPDAAHMRAEAEVFLTMLERHYGQRPVVYTTVDFFADTELGRLPRTDFWLRSVAGHPSKVYPGQSWTFWQYSGTGLVPGFSGKVDLNVFHGSVGAWQAWVGAREHP